MPELCVVRRAAGRREFDLGVAVAHYTRRAFRSGTTATTAASTAATAAAAATATSTCPPSRASLLGWSSAGAASSLGRRAFA